jgi:probable phosphoglycerate mutase
MIHDAECDIEVQTDECFNEIDHGPDENKTEGEILERIGRDALDDWNEFGVAPNGWKVNPRKLQKSWIKFSDQCLTAREGKLTCVVSSGGIIRFAPILLTDNQLPDGQSAKVKTASMSLFSHNGSQWICEFWNKRPS